MATKINVVDKRTGEVKEITLLNPHEKGQKYALELANGEKMNGQTLNASQASYRMGYLQSRRDSARVYNAKHNLSNQKKGSIYQILNSKKSGQKASKKKAGGKSSKKNLPVTTEFGDGDF